MKESRGAPNAIAAIDAKVRRRLSRIPRALASRAPHSSAGGEGRKALRSRKSLSFLFAPTPPSFP